MIISVLLVVATTTLLATNVRAQNNGDIRLVNNVKKTIDAYQGRLEVFIDGKWGTICIQSGFNFQPAADTACRQLGLKEAVPDGYGTVTELGYPIAPDSTPIHFRSIDCPSPSDIDYQQHVLRCVISEDTTTCTHKNDLGIYCSTENITSNPWLLQVALYTIGDQPHLLMCP